MFSSARLHFSAKEEDHTPKLQPRHWKEHWMKRENTTLNEARGLPQTPRHTSATPSGGGRAATLKTTNRALHILVCKQTPSLWGLY